MTWNELAASVASNLDRPYDYPLREQLVSEAGLWLSRLIRDTLVDRPGEAVHFYQTIYRKMGPWTRPGCVPDVQCPMFESEELPAPVRVGSSLFDYVGSIDGRRPYRLLDEGGFLEYGKFAHTQRFYRWEKDQAQKNRVITFHNPQVIRLKGIWAVPVDPCVQATGASACKPWDAEIVAPGDVQVNLMAYLTQMHASGGQSVSVPRATRQEAP